MNTTVNSYLKTLTNNELEKLMNDTKALCKACSYDSPTGCTAKTCSVLTIIEQVNAEFNFRNKIKG